MNITMTLNGKKISADIDADMLLIDFVRDHGCYSVKRGCETSNCGLCTVFLDEKPVLSCSVLAARADGRTVTTLEGLQEEAKEFGAFIADQGAEQCGFCNPGFIMNALALFRETSTRKRKRSGNILPATCAAAQAMRDSSAGSRRSLHGKRRKAERSRRSHEICKSTGTEKGRDAARNGTAGLCG